MQELVNELIKQHLTISCYESLTGGLFASQITSVPGASQVFPGSLVTYSNAVKIQVGHVPASTIEQYGVVSSQTATAMARACQNLFATDIAISFTGNAGPTAQGNGLVGDAYITIIIKNCTYEFEYHWGNQYPRNQLRQLLITQAIEETLKKLLGNS